MSYLEFGTGDMSPCSFTFWQAFHHPPKPPFSRFARVTVQVQAIAPHYAKACMRYCNDQTQLVGLFFKKGVLEFVV